MTRSIVLGLSLACSTAYAADISSIQPTGPTGNLTGNFTSSSTWQGGVVPGANDRAFVLSSGLIWTITYDAGAPATLQSWFNSRPNLYFNRSVTVTGNFSLREGNIRDQGHDITILGTLSNSSAGGSDGSGGTLTRGGGTYTIGSLSIQRTSQFSFRSGDTINGSYNTGRLFNTWPDVEVRQDATFHSSDLDAGLSFDSASGSINLGYTNAGDKAEIQLFWDAGLQGTIDWTLRWRGNHETTLRNYYSTGQLVIGSLPAGESFSATENIFYNADDDYTYVGFTDPDQDGDGVPNGSDVCPSDPGKSSSSGFCGCDFIDLDIDVDTLDETCVHRTAFVAPTARLEPGATIFANAVVAPRAEVGGTVGENAIVGRNADVQGTVGDDAIVGRGATLALGATLGDRSTLGYASDINNSSIGDDSVIGALVALGYSSSVGDGSVIGRQTDIGNSVQVSNDVVVGPDSDIENNCVFESGVRIRKNAAIGSNVTVRQDARVGRDSALGTIGGTATEVGSDANLKASVTVPAGFCVPSNESVSRSTTVTTACP